MNCASKETTVPLPLSQLLCWLMVCLSCLNSAQAQTAATPKPRGTAQPAAPEVTGGPCLIAEFRLLALTTHDPQERQNKSIEWLQKNNANCSSVQLSILHSSKAALMGTADSIALSATLDAIMEKRMANNPEALNRYYRPEVQGPGRSKTETAAAGPDSGAAKPAGSGGAPPSVAAVGAVLAPTPGMLPGAGGAAAPANQNININLGGAKPPEEDMSRKMPLPNEPLFVFPPDVGAPMLNYFGKIRRQFARSFFMETLSPGKCPEGMTWRSDKCEANLKVAWRFGEKVPQGVKTYPVEPKLIEKLNFDAGYTFVRIGGDILALERDTGKIADAILNLGKTS
jgi:hypothetical protein